MNLLKAYTPGPQTEHESIKSIHRLLLPNTPPSSYLGRCPLPARPTGIFEPSEVPAHPRPIYYTIYIHFGSSRFGPRNKPRLTENISQRVYSMYQNSNGASGSSGASGMTMRKRDRLFDAMAASHGVADQSSSHTHDTRKRRDRLNQVPEERVTPTTICFKNIPNCYTRQTVFELLDSTGFKGSCDFIYVPHSTKRLPKLVSLGYFFVNFVSHEVAVRALERFTGFTEWAMPSDKIMCATWAARTQGQKACINIFLKDRGKFPKHCGPLIFIDGVVVPFDPPRKTKMLGDKPSKGFCGKPTHEPDESESTTSRRQTCEAGAPISLAKDFSVEIGNSHQECGADAEYVISKEEASHADEAGVPMPFSWMPDGSASNCIKCEEPFTLFRRRHHCRGCGDICCAECVPRTNSAWSPLMSPTQEPTSKRVCKDCAQGLETSPPLGLVMPGAPHVLVR